MPTTLHSLLLLLTLIFSTPVLLSSTPTIPTHNRRALHQPFFPLLSIPSPPSQPPTTSPFPKYPSPNPRPFFPIYPSPPPPPSPPLPSFPTNLSSLPVPSRSSSRKLAPLIALPATALALLVLSLAFLLHRRCRSAAADAADGSDSHRLFPPDCASSEGRKQSASSTPTGTEFLYLGTLVNSRGRVDDPPAAAVAASASSPCRKLDSPELRPLPPLSLHVRHAVGSSSPEEEFYSPSYGSPGEKGKSVSPTISSPSYPSSNLVSSHSPSSASSPAISSSPAQSTIRAPAAGDTGFRPPPPPAPPRLFRPMTPSPPKRKPSSPCLPSSPPEKESDKSLRIWNFSGQNLHFPAIAGDFARNPFAVSPPPRRTPPPPPPPLSENSEVVAESELNHRPKLKPLHWDKVRASSDRAMVWDQLLKSSSFKLNEEMIEALFICEATKGTTRQQVSFSPNQEISVLDPKKSQNIAILLRALNVAKEEVCEALLEGNADILGNELLETLLKMAPSKEEEFRLKEYKDDSPFKLGPAEKFLKAVLDVPFAFKRLDAMLYIINFESEIDYLRKSFESLEAACGELRSSRLFFKLLEAVLKTGNRMNVGTNRGDAQAFKLDTLLKLVDVKGTDGKTTLLHFVVQEITKSEGARFSTTTNSSTTKSHAAASRDALEYKRLGLQVVSRLGDELGNVKKAAGMDSDVLSSYVSKLARGIGKISEVLRLNEGLSSKEDSHRFHDVMNGFLKKAEDEIVKLQSLQRVAMSMVKGITTYFYGDSAKEEPRPFRIFLVVRDFLAVLDQVCKEIGRINEQTAVSSMHHHLPSPVNPTLPPVFPGLSASRPGSSDDESSSSTCS